MSAKTSIFYDIITQYNDKGAKAAEKSFLKLGELGKKIAGAFAAGELLKFAGETIKLAAAENKQFLLLDNTLTNLGLGFAAENSNKMIDSMALATGVAKSELIPAYQQLLTATSNVKLSQENLRLAMDVSAGTGKDLQTVTTALSKGYLGNTVALTRLGAGLDKTLLKTGDMKLITEQLNKTFGGDSALAADSYAGKLARINVAVEQAKVNIGDGLINALTSLSQSSGFDSLLSAITTFGTKIGDAISGVGDLIQAIHKIPGAGLLGKVLSFVGNYSTIGLLAKYHENNIKKNDIFTAYVDPAQIGYASTAQKKALDNKAKQLAADKAILAAQKAQTIEQQKQATLKLIGTQSDQIAMAEIYAAKQKDISAQDALQLDLQLKILEATNSTGTAALKAADDALILQEKILMANGLIKLADGSIVNLSTAKNPFAGFDKYVADALQQIAKVQAAVSNIPSTGSGYDNRVTGNNGSSQYGFGGGGGVDTHFTDSNSAYNNTNPYNWFANSPAYDPMNGNANINVTVGIDPNSGNLYSMVQNANYSNTANGNAATINRNNGLSGGYG